MLEDGISSLIVVDQQKRGVGILTKSDLIELIHLIIFKEKIRLPTL